LTPTLACGSAKDTGYRKEFSDGSGTGVNLFWPLVSAVPTGGLVATTLLVLAIGAAALRSRRRPGREEFD
jgi:hypothetical protein